MCHTSPFAIITFMKTFLHYFLRHKNTYRKVLSSNTSRLEAHAGLIRLLMKRFFALMTVTFWQKVDFLKCNRTCDYTVFDKMLFFLFSGGNTKVGWPNSILKNCWHAHGK